MATLPDIQDDHLFAVRLMEHLVVPTFVLNSNGDVIIWNKACERLTGVSAEEVLHTKNHWCAFYDKPRACLADILVHGRADEMEGLYTSYSAPGDSHQGLRAENWCVMPKAAKRLYLAINSGPIYNDTGELIAVVETLRDMTEQKQAENALQSLAHKDGLTGIANRRSFDMALEADLLHAKRERAPLALLLGDIDHFKLYNDLYGHQKGDRCLKLVAKAIAAEVKRPSDLAARYGGEEFAVILPGIDAAGALRVAESIRTAVFALNERHKGSETSDRVTLSIGLVCLVPDDVMSEADLIERADKALYTAKESGRNQVVVADATA
ncbi:sensor domain-containing diguanylate cyclase [Magnetovibrio blakemorei]|uniref:diguanylate cyclase n=1 Tax=Magnetovibrio blakemorei TaxID=28181 RepID=A0A1E5Q408_9PROT|nr:diguanylate cyclase [Magnetovibrio blakemorei]OEJ64605.1 diguanylate cyclase [Magnetovibrio blakemorei]